MSPISDRTVRTRFEAITGQYEAAMAQMGASTKATALSIDSLVGKSKGSFKSIGMDLAGIGSSGQLAAAGAAVAAVAVLKLARDGVNAYVGLASEVRAYQRIAGGSAEDSSRMVAAFHAVGVESETGATAVFRLSQNLERNSESLRAAGVVVARDKQGNVDLSRTLLNLSDAYRNIQDPQQRNVLMMQALGRGAVSLSPLLAAGRHQIEEFWKAAGQHGLVFSQSDLDQARQYKLAVHDLGEAWRGVEVQIGKAAVPALTAGAQALGGVAEGVDKAGAVVSKAGIPFGGFGRLLGGLAKDSFPEVAVATDLLRGHFVGAVTDLIPYGNTLHNLFFHHNKAAEAAKKHAQAEAEAQVVMGQISQTTGVSVGRLRELAQTMGIDLATGGKKAADALQAAAGRISEAVTPTEKLAAVTGVLRDAYATTSEQVKAFDTALSGTLGAQLDANSAALKLRQSMQGLADDMVTGQKTGESYGAYQDRLSGDLIGVVQNIQAMGKALLTNGQLGADAGSQSAFMIQMLQKEASQFPQLAFVIGQYIAALSKIPGAVNEVGTSGVLAADRWQRSWTSAGAALRGINQARIDAATASAGLTPDTVTGTANDKQNGVDALAAFLKAVEQQRREILTNQYSLGKISLDQYLAELNRELSGEKAYTSEWMAIQQKKQQALNDLAGFYKGVIDHQHELEDNEFALGAKSKDDYLAILRERLKGLEEYSNAWTQIMQQIQQVEGAALAAQLNIIKAVDQQRLADQAFYALADQRKMSASWQMALNASLSPAQPSVIVQAGKTVTYNPTLNAYGSDATKAATTANQQMRDYAALVGV